MSIFYSSASQHTSALHHLHTALNPDASFRHATFSLSFSTQLHSIQYTTITISLITLYSIACHITNSILNNSPPHTTNTCRLTSPRFLYLTELHPSHFISPRNNSEPLLNETKTLRSTLKHIITLHPIRILPHLQTLRLYH